MGAVGDRLGVSEGREVDREGSSADPVLIRVRGLWGGGTCVQVTRAAVRGFQFRK